MQILPKSRARTYHSRAGRSSNHAVGGWVPAWVGLGANLGDARAVLARAVRWLGAVPGCEVDAVSDCRVTEPIGPPQPRYLNAVVRLRVRMPPLALLDALQRLEKAAGRRREVRWGPRTLDLDLLLYGARGARVMETERLSVPHPRLHERGFVLEPLCDLDPGLRHPLLDRTLRHLLVVYRGEID